MNAGKRILGPERGQALPLCVLACILLATLTILLFKSGRLLLERAQYRARMDATAISAGVDYARCLNVLAILENGQALGYIFDAIILVGTGGASAELQAAGASFGAKVAKVQDVFLKAGPFLVAGSAVMAGLQNGLVVVPAWNHEEGRSLPIAESLIPDFNVGRRAPIPDFEKVLASIKDKPHQGRPYEFSQKKVRTKRLVEVNPKEVERIRIRRKGRLITAYRHKKTKKFVAARKTPLPLPMDLEDLGDHTLALWGTQSPFQEPFRRVYLTSKVRVGGGHFDASRFGSTRWGAFLVPSLHASQNGSHGLKRLGYTGISAVDEGISVLNQGLAAFHSSEEILH